ncbi:hypothetical protein ABZ915_21580 [Streptomyces sp. NPDC046915]|uniref:hypothetical protein n=1 Tax=Streptomyces sp. NPDC046915 TaxID=3155257 RepID=UPI0033F115AC
MLAEAFTALATAGGAAVVQAAGTDAWSGLRQGLVRLIGRGDSGRERTVEERLDRTAGALVAARGQEAEALRIQEEAAWRGRFADLLEDLGEAERHRVATELRALLGEYVAAAAGTVSAPGGVAAHRDVNIRADNGIAAAVVHGGVHLAHPRLPDPPQG